ncbi:hypothetical protein QUF99_21950 [Bacillus sp. DX4.1]|uniref:hypothetical protein n=1 Tax=Bacillus sp. DX4.1 TaxID=3055867 RepID=UPI0025A1F648|nr:hypothetical protein [Bacillus sp. DX4.1]MDM5189888.1 hypothetical protein [Bacillus sp. DX4.1]
MTNLIKNEETFIIDANVRESYMNRVDILERVKGLLLLPNLEMATTQQVADFYEVPVSTLPTVILENKDELVSDEYISQTGKEIKGNLGSPKNGRTNIVNKRGHFLIETDNGFGKMSNNTCDLTRWNAVKRQRHRKGSPYTTFKH